MIDAVVYAATDAMLYYGIALSLWLSFRILRYPDLALEQSFVLGSAIYVIVHLSGWSPATILPLLALAALVLGITTSLLRNAAGINPILVSLLATYVLYSVSLALLGRPNVYLAAQVEGTMVHDSSRFVPAVSYGALVLALAVTMRTNLGLRVIAAGSNWTLASRQRLHPHVAYCAGMVAASFCALTAGCLHARRSGYADVGSGAGLLLVALFTVLATRAMQRRIHLVWNALGLFAILTSYLVVLQIVISLGIPPQWLSATKAFALLIVLLLMPRDARGDFRLLA